MTSTDDDNGAMADAFDVEIEVDDKSIVEERAMPPLSDPVLAQVIEFLDLLSDLDRIRLLELYDPDTGKRRP